MSTTWVQIDLQLDRVASKARNIAHPRTISDEERNDTRHCKNCGGLSKEHYIYGTIHHVPDLDKTLWGYQVATAFCEKFEA